MVVLHEPVCVVTTGESNDNIGGFFATRITNIWCHSELIDSLLAVELM